MFQRDAKYPIDSSLSRSTQQTFDIAYISNFNRSKMTSTLPRRAIIAVTSAQAPLHHGETTGLFISEALHPFNVLTQAGFEVDLASETGKYTPDWLSLTPDYLSGDDLKTWENTSSDFRKKLDNMSAARTHDPSKYGIFFASAGHAALLDYPTAGALQNIASTVWKNGGIVCSVCHGPAIFTNVLDSKNQPIIKGRRLTGFTTSGETTMNVLNELKALKVELVEDLVPRLGGTCEFQTAHSYLRPP